VIYVVLGMHKSGTTLVSEILHHSGIEMGEPEDIPLDRGYDRGNKYERAAAVAIDKDILGAHGVPSERIRAPRQLPRSPEVIARMASLVADLNQRCSDWGFKDPRACLTYPLWEAALPEHRIVAVYRPLHELTERKGGDQSPVQAYRLVRSWHEHNAALLSILKVTPMPWIALHYGRLMEGDIEFRRLERFVGRPLTDRRRPEMRRGTPKAGIWMRVAEALYKRRTGRVASTTLAELDGLAEGVPA